MFNEEEYFSQMVKWRRYLHQNPELSFKELNTSKWLKETLIGMKNFTIISIGKISFVAEIDGLKESNTESTLAFRTEMDALPIQEKTELAFSSRCDGVMHACGHDGHMAILLGFAKYLSENRCRFSQKIKLVFQSAEEIPPGGAKLISESGVLNDVDEIYAFHIFPNHPAGSISISEGVATASQDIFRVNITGKGTHGAYPEKGIDPILVASEIISSLNHIVSRSISSFDTAVISVGQVHSGQVFNVIPDTAFIEGNIRTFSSDARKTIKERIQSIITGISKAYDAKAEVEFKKGYNPVINNQKCVMIAEIAAKRAVGESNVFHNARKMVSEDFSAYTDFLKGCFMILGGGETEQFSYMNHHPKFDFCEKTMVNGLLTYVDIVTDGGNNYEPEFV